jgi:hypothetical protein
VVWPVHDQQERPKFGVISISARSRVEFARFRTEALIMAADTASGGAARPPGQTSTCPHFCPEGERTRIGLTQPWSAALSGAPRESGAHQQPSAFVHTCIHMRRMPFRIG